MLRKLSVAAVTLMLLCGAGTLASDLNEVGALLVFPAIAAFDAASPGGTIETFITVTNTGVDNVTAHVSFIDGVDCFECNFSFPLTGYDTETLVVTVDPLTQTTLITSLDGTVNRSCPYDVGMMVVALEDGENNTITDNLLFGEQIVVNYTNGWAFSIPAIPFQGGVGDGDRNYEFDGVEYAGFPRRIAADFLTPRAPQLPPLLVAEIVLFTLNFETQIAPLSDCSVNGFDAHENNFSNSLIFGCWDYLNLCEDIDPEFCYPNLGNPGSDEHGWVTFDCEVDGAQGAVHGAIVQVAETGTTLRPNAPGPATAGWTAWARTLYQSATAGSNTMLSVNAAPPGSGGFD